MTSGGGMQPRTASAEARSVRANICSPAAYLVTHARGSEGSCGTGRRDGLPLAAHLPSLKMRTTRARRKTRRMAEPEPASPSSSRYHGRIATCARSPPAWLLGRGKREASPCGGGAYQIDDVHGLDDETGGSDEVRGIVRRANDEPSQVLQRELRGRTGEESSGEDAMSGGSPPRSGRDEVPAARLPSP